MNENYYAFLLRIYRPRSFPGTAWRVSLEDPHTRQVIDFSSVEALYEFLLQLVSRGEQANERPPPHKPEI